MDLRIAAIEGYRNLTFTEALMVMVAGAKK